MRSKVLENVPQIKSALDIRDKMVSRASEEILKVISENMNDIFPSWQRANLIKERLWSQKPAGILWSEMVFELLGLRVKDSKLRISIPDDLK